MQKGEGACQRKITVAPNEREYDHSNKRGLCHSYPFVLISIVYLGKEAFFKSLTSVQLSPIHDGTHVGSW